MAQKQLTQKGNTSMSKKIRVAIIGQGRSGRNIHGEYLITDPRYKIVAVSDLLEDRRKRAIAEYKCDAYADYRDMLKRKDVDLVVNASLSYMHVPITLEILKAGFNVLCEKPLASRVKDVDKMIAAAKKARRLFAVFQQSRLSGYFMQIQKVIKSGVLGRIIQVNIAFNGFSRRWDWQTLQEFNGGNLLNTGPHPLDQALELFGSGMPKVLCFMDRVNTVGDAEDHVKMILSGPGRPTIDLEISSACAYPCYTYNIYGSRGGLKGSTSAMEWRYFKPSEARKLKLVKTPLASSDGIPAYCDGVKPDNLKWHVDAWPVSTKPGKKPEGVYKAHNPRMDMSGAFYTMLYKALTKKAPLTITPEQVRRQIAVIEECQRQNPQIYGKK
jgi:predicted dehydrogenase